MPNKNYLKGRRLEYKVSKWLREDGFTVIRAAGSKGPYDLVGIHPKYNLVFLVQVKGHKGSVAQTTRMGKAFQETPPFPPSSAYDQAMFIFDSEGVHTYYVFTGDLR